jgi:hypothetical protein
VSDVMLDSMVMKFLMLIEQATHVDVALVF